MITGPLRSIPPSNSPNPDRLRDLLDYIAEVLMKLDQAGLKAQISQGETACTGEVLEVTPEPATS